MTPPLLAQRCSAQRWQAALARGGDGTELLLGGPGAGLPVLAPQLHSADGWWVDHSAAAAPLVQGLPAEPPPALQLGHCGAVAWRRCGPWLHGVLDLPDDGSDLQALARSAYGDVFSTLHNTGTPRLLRLWNYLPRIHDENLGLERYRQFNAGRQQAFIDAGHSAFDGAPAACALGSHDSTLRVRFLAGQQPPVPVENPRQISAYRYPSDYGPRSPTFSRAALANVGGGRVALFVSGTASIVGHASLHAGDVRAQTHETLRNLHSLLHAAQQRSGLAFDLRQMVSTVYIRHAADLAAVQQVLTAELGADAPLCTGALWLQADVCRSELLVEIEGHLLVEGSLPAA